VFASATNSAEMSSNNLTAMVRERLAAEGQQPAPVVDDSAWQQTEDVLGFTLPPLLHSLFREIGNGGFGPGYGLRGALGGTRDDNGWDLVSYYRICLDPNPDQPSWVWPKGLVGLNDWGCGIVSCVDCRSPEFPIVCFDPNVLDFEDARTWQNAFRSEERSFPDWILAWAKGEDGFPRNSNG
jgi:hypothetical protein